MNQLEQTEEEDTLSQMLQKLYDLSMAFRVARIQPTLSLDLIAEEMLKAFDKEELFYLIRVLEAKTQDC